MLSVIGMLFKLNKNCFPGEVPVNLASQITHHSLNRTFCPDHGFHSVLNKKKKSHPLPPRGLSICTGTIKWGGLIFTGVLLRSSSLLVLRFVLVSRRESQVERCNPISALSFELAHSGSPGRAMV